jgi:excisionase family DNA binding protein
MSKSTKRNQQVLPETPPKPQRLITVGNTAVRLDCHPATVRRPVKAGKLRAVRVGTKSLRVVESSLELLIDKGETDLTDLALAPHRDLGTAA